MFLLYTRLLQAGQWRKEEDVEMAERWNFCSQKLGECTNVHSWHDHQESALTSFCTCKATGFYTIVHLSTLRRIRNCVLLNLSPYQGRPQAQEGDFVLAHSLNVRMDRTRYLLGSL